MPRHPEAGRKAGTPNKSSLKVIDQLISKDINPVEKILALLEHGDISDSKKLQGWMQVMSYCFPQLKSVELQGDADRPLTVSAENIAALCKLARSSNG